MELLSFSYLIIEIALIALAITLFSVKFTIWGLIPLAVILFYPFIYELILFCIYRFFYSFRKQPYKNCSDDISLKKSNIVYDPRYNIKLCGIEKRHPFDSCKYERVMNFLKQDHQLDFQISQGPSSKLLKKRHAD